MNRVAILCACLAVQAPLTSAQTSRITGLVRDSASATPIAGAVVSELDAGNTSVGRVITNAGGQYSMVLAASATQLRVVRIGFQPRTITLDGKRTDRPVVDVAMMRIPTLLSSVTVNDDRVCSEDKDRSAAASLWEQARAGLLASVVARETQPAHTTLYGYERVIDMAQNRVVRQVAHTSTGESTRPFVAPSEPQVLARRGYAEFDLSGGRVFKSPDADVLLDDSFAQTHCFTVRREDRQHPGQIGLAFEPMRGRQSIVDVRGTLWLEAGITPSLRLLEFRYTGSDPVLTHERAVGRVQFRTMPNGVVFIDEWQVNLPVLQQSAGSRDVNGARINRTFGADAALRLVQMSETGGLVLSAVWTDGARYTTALQPVAGLVTESGSRKPLPGAMVYLDGTADTVLTDNVGRFAIFPVLPGRYEIHAADTTLFEFARVRDTDREIDVTGATPALTLELPSRAAALKQYCGADQSASSATVVGRLVDRTAGSRNLADVRVTTSWWQLPMMSANAIAARQDTQQVNVDELGRFSLCRIPRGRSVGLTVSHLGTPYADTVVTIGGTAEIVTVAWPVNLDGLLSAKARPPARLVGRVTRAGRPVSGADVWIPTLDAHVSTDSSGQFHFDGLSAATLFVQVRRLGFPVLRDTVTVASGVVTTRDFAFSSAATQLDTNRTIASSLRRVSPSLQAFEARRARMPAGDFLSDSTLRMHDGENLSSVIVGRLSGLALLPGHRGASYLASSRARCSGNALRGCKPCYTTVYIDGTLIYSAISDQNVDPPDATRLRVSEMAGIEWYPNGGSAPPEYNKTDSGCGVLLLWTRER